MLSGVAGDFRFAWRSLRRQPVALVATVLLLGLGIGACTVLFSAVDAVLLRRLPVLHPDELVRMVVIRPNLGARSNFSYPYVRALRERSKTMHEVFAWWPLDVALTQNGAAERIRVHVVTARYFEALGIRAALGRAIEPADDQPARPAVAVLSDGFWKRRFGGDRGVLGRTVMLNGRAFTVTGVLSPDFTGLSIETSPDMCVPVSTVPLLQPGRELDNEDEFALEVAARLRPGVAALQAGQEAAQLQKAMQKPGADATWERELNVRIEAEPLGRGVSPLRQQFGTALVALLFGLGLLMTMVCASVAGLLLARSAARGQEWALRLAIGASRWQIARLIVPRAWFSRAPESPPEWVSRSSHCRCWCRRSLPYATMAPPACRWF